MRPVRVLPSTWYEDHHTLGFGAVGGFPQRQERIATRLQLLLLLQRHLPFERTGFLLATLGQWLAFSRFFDGRRGRILGLNRQDAGKQQ